MHCIPNCIVEKPLTNTIIITIIVVNYGRGKWMKFITVTELRLKATEVVRKIVDSGEEVVITKNGKPVVLMQSINEDAFLLRKDKGKNKGR